MNLAVFSSSPNALSTLDKLNQDFSVKLIVTKTTAEPIIAWSLKKNIPHETPNSLKVESYKVIKLIKDLKIDLILVIDFGLLIPKEIFDAPSFKTINIHFSLLPKYRGPYPDAFVLLNGEKKTGISFVLIEEGFDTGNILAQKEIKVKNDETAGELHLRLYQETIKDISYILKSWGEYKMNNNYNHYNDYNAYKSLFLPPKKQDNSAATFTKKLNRDDGFIEWKIVQKIIKNERVNFEEMPDLIKNYCHCDPPKAEKQSSQTDRSSHFARDDTLFYNFFRALSPWPGVWTLFNGKRLKILKMHLENENLIIDQVQLEGKNPVSFKQFRQAYNIV